MLRNAAVIPFFISLLSHTLAIALSKRFYCKEKILLFSIFYDLFQGMFQRIYSFLLLFRYQWVTGFNINPCQYSDLLVKSVFESLDCNCRIESLVHSDCSYFLTLSITDLLIRLMLHVGRFVEINALLLPKSFILSSIQCSSWKMALQFDGIVFLVRLC